MEVRLSHLITNHRGAGVLRLSPEENRRDRTVVLLHGLGGAKEHALPQLFRMAQAGFDAVAIDLFLHGDRPEASNFNRFLEANYAGTVLTITNESVDDIPAICGEIGVDIARAGLLGISTGGFVAHALAIRRPQFGATVAAITSPEWLTIDPEQSALLSPMEAAMLAQISPVNHPAQYAPMPICMLHSAGDSTVRIQGTQTLAERLQPIYESLQISDRLKLKVYPDDEHRFSEDMLDETIAWMNLHL